MSEYDAMFAKSALDLATTGTFLVPPSLGDVHVLRMMPSHNAGQPCPSEILRLLLPDPGSIFSSLCFPIEIRSAPIAADGMPFQDDSRRRQSPQQQIERRRIGVGSSSVSMPRDLYEDTLGFFGRQDTSKRFGE